MVGPDHLLESCLLVITHMAYQFTETRKGLLLVTMMLPLIDYSDYELDTA